jgi:hypothetical protein
MDDIINTLTGNVNTNDNLVDQVLALIADLKRQQAEQQALQVQIGAAAGNEIANLEGRIRELEANLAAYRERLTAANNTLITSLNKLNGAIRPAAPIPPPRADGKRRSRKRNSRKRKSKRSRKSKKRHY